MKNSDFPMWKRVMQEPNQLVTYSTGDDGLVVFWSSDIREIRVSGAE
jgi:hypothetical protein